MPVERGAAVGFKAITPSSDDRRLEARIARSAVVGTGGWAAPWHGQRLPAKPNWSLNLPYGGVGPAEIRFISVWNESLDPTVILQLIINNKTVKNLS